MSHESPSTPVPRDRREAVREKAEQVHARQSRARVVRRVSLVIGVVAVVAAVAVVVTWTVSSAVNRPQLSPSGITDDGFTITTASVSLPQAADVPDSGEVAKTTATEAATAEATPAPTATARPVVEIRVYVDYLSPGAREWQLANAQQLTSWVGEGAITLAYHPVAMLTAKSNGTKYSLRAAGAAACVASHSPDTFFAFSNELLSRQPAVDADGFTDQELADLAIASGATSPKAVRACIEEESYASWARAATERAVAGIPDTDHVALTGTPMILVNGEPYVGALDDPAEFSQFVLSSASDEFYKTQTSAPTATPTPTATPDPNATPTP
ncbi:DsbA family protein [Microbacterium sp.]|uniref:DsbA family protein n=1 Tax=Microbacterium sp. TaxID=51671 RepID=UPI0039E47E69